MNDVMCSAVASTLDELELHYKQDGEFFTFTVGDDVADFPIRIVADEEQELLVVIGYFPVKISKASLDKMYKVVNDLNYQTLAGHFAVDSRDGELTFRQANNVDGGAINDAIVRACFLQVVSRLRNSYEEIMKAMYGGSQMNFTFAPSESHAADNT